VSNDINRPVIDDRVAVCKAGVEEPEETLAPSTKYGLRIVRKPEESLKREWISVTVLARERFNQRLLSMTCSQQQARSGFISFHAPRGAFARHAYRDGRLSCLIRHQFS